MAEITIVRITPSKIDFLFDGQVWTISGEVYVRNYASPTYERDYGPPDFKLPGASPDFVGYIGSIEPMSSEHPPVVLDDAKVHFILQQLVEQMHERRMSIEFEP